MADRNHIEGLLTPDLLHDYQDSAIDRLYEDDGVIAVLTMGAGKTVCALTATAELLRDGHIDRAWVIAPKRVANEVWHEEAAKWAHTAHLRIVRVTGTKPQRERALTEDADIYVINFDNLQWLQTEMRKFPKRTLLIVDEVSRLKNPTGQRGKALRRMLKNVDICWGLTGTPAPKSLFDLFMPVLTICGDKVWGKSFYRWRKLNFMQADYSGFKWEPLPEHDRKIEDAFATVSFKVSDAQIAKAKVEPTFVDDFVTLPKKHLDAHNKALKAWILDVEGGQRELLAHAAVGTMKARQIASGAVLDSDGEVIDVHTSKIDALAELIEDTEGENLMVAYQFRSEIAAIKARFEKPGQPIPVIGGGTSDRQAAEWLAAWKAGQVPLMLIHPASAGHGLNLQSGGRRLVWFTLPYGSLELYQQTNARLARQGQKRQVFIHHLLARGTIDDQAMMLMRDEDAAQEWLINRIDTLLTAGQKKKLGVT